MVEKLALRVEKWKGHILLFILLTVLIVQVEESDQCVSVSVCLDNMS